MLQIQNFHEQTFDWLSWRSGNLLDLSLNNREDIIVANKEKIRKYAIGWCDGENLPCRPKYKTIAVYFFKNNEWWTHLTIKEFQICFPELKNYLKK